MTQEQISRPVALGFTDGMTALEELHQRVKAGHHDFAIMLAGGLAISRKGINFTEGRWEIVNDIDGSRQSLLDPDLWSQSNIGEALDKRALLDMSGDPMLMTITECPICGAALQATEVREVWLNITACRVDPMSGDVEINEDPDIYGENSNTEIRIYCANDHTSKEMAAALKEEIS